jgi:hypothetical protein
MAVQEYLGSKIYQDMLAKAIEDSEEFIRQSGSTKLMYVDNMRVENSMFKQSTDHLINVIDEVEAENEHLEKKNQYYEKTYGSINPDFNDKGNLDVVRTSEKLHAKRALTRYIKKYEEENGYIDNKKANPSEIPAPLPAQPPKQLIHTLR